MNWIIPVLLFVVLGALAVVHALWAMRWFWPLGDEQALVDYVVGIPGMRKMPPPGACWLVAASLAFAACVGLALGAHYADPIDKALAWIGAGFIAVFAIRGLGGYTPFWRAAHSVEEFALLDKRFYSPACVLIAEGFFLLVSDRL